MTGRVLAGRGCGGREDLVPGHRLLLAVVTGHGTAAVEHQADGRRGQEPVVVVQFLHAVGAGDDADVELALLSVGVDAHADLEVRLGVVHGGHELVPLGHAHAVVPDAEPARSTRVPERVAAGTRTRGHAVHVRGVGGHLVHAPGPVLELDPAAGRWVEARLALARSSRRARRALAEPAHGLAEQAHDHGGRGQQEDHQEAEQHREEGGQDAQHQEGDADHREDPGVLEQGHPRGLVVLGGVGIVAVTTTVAGGGGLGVHRGGRVAGRGGTPAQRTSSSVSVSCTHRSLSRSVWAFTHRHSRSSPPVAQRSIVLSGCCRIW